MKNKISMFGTGGYAKEAFEIVNVMTDIEIENFIVSDDHYSSEFFMGYPVLMQSDFDSNSCAMVIAIGDSLIRKKIVESLPKDTNYQTIIHPSSRISPFSKIGKGSIISAESVISIDVVIGSHAQINFHSSIGHDCKIGNFFTSCPGARVSGNCKIGNQVFLGTNSSLRQNLNIMSNANIGIGAVILNDIDTEGTFFGNPARRMR
mgnify:FL=1